MWICFTLIFLFPSYHLFSFHSFDPSLTLLYTCCHNPLIIIFLLNSAILNCSHCRSSSTKLNCSHGSNSFCWLDIVFHLCCSHSNSLVTFTISILLLLNSFRSTMAKADKTMQMNAEKLKGMLNYPNFKQKLMSAAYGMSNRLMLNSCINVVFV
jgi:hypothetical protein